MAMMLVKQCKSLGCDRLQIWLESGTRQEGVDLVLGDDLEIDGEALYINDQQVGRKVDVCLLYTSPSPRDLSTSRMPSSA